MGGRSMLDHEQHDRHVQYSNGNTVALHAWNTKVIAGRKGRTGSTWRGLLEVTGLHSEESIVERNKEQNRHWLGSLYLLIETHERSTIY